MVRSGLDPLHVRTGEISLVRDQEDDVGEVWRYLRRDLTELEALTDDDVETVRGKVLERLHILVHRGGLRVRSLGPELRLQNRQSLERELVEALVVG